MITEPDHLFGIPVQVSPALPIVPSDGENARRIVRHGLADVLCWLKQSVGPKPGEEAHVFILPDDRSMLISAGMKTALLRSMDLTGYTREGAKPYLEEAWAQRNLLLMKGYRI